MKHALFGTEDYKTYVKKRAALGDAFSRSKIVKARDMIVDYTEKGCDQIKKQTENGGTVDLAFVVFNPICILATNFNVFSVTSIGQQLQRLLHGISLARTTTLSMTSR